ncbi:MAG: cytochrome b [Pseudomonadota bacterium]|nr:MAG: cytochrome B [Pseudomonadota bacterium]
MTEYVPNTDPPVERYSAVARAFHWITVAFVAVQVPIGLAMVYRGYDLNIWDETTNSLYSTHKLLGFILLWVVLARLAYRLVHGAPKPEPTLEPWQRTGSAIVHWLLYVLLIVLPILGWTGISLYPALDIFGLFSLPALTSANQELANQVLAIHASLAWLLIVLVIGHAGMALFHYFVRKDNVLRRMLTGLPKR